MTFLTRVNIVLGILLAVLLGIAVAMDVDYTEPNVEFLPEMKRSPAFSAFAANSVFPNGRTLQSSVPGTIPRGDLPLYYAATKEDALRAGEELQNPIVLAVAEAEKNLLTASESNDSTVNDSVTPKIDSVAAPDPQVTLTASVQRGAQAYGIFCISCHGSSGAGDGPVAKRGFPPPPPLGTGKSAKMKDGQLFHILTYGQGSMPSMKAQLSQNARWDVVNYVRSLQKAVPPAKPVSIDTPPDTNPASESESGSGRDKSVKKAAPETESSKETEEFVEGKS